MSRSRTVALVVGVFAVRLAAQTPTTPPSNPPAPVSAPAPVNAPPQVTAPAQVAAPTTIVLDSFDSVSQWTATPAEGVELTVHSDSTGAHGRSMRLDFDFHGHGGYAVVHRAFNLALPANYEFTFAIRGEGVAPDGSRTEAPKNT